MTKAIKFNGADYTEADLKTKSIEDLLTLRNLVATNLGVATVKSFKDHDAAVTQTWKALERFDSQTEEDAAAAPKEKKEKAPKEKKDRPLAKSAEAKTVKRPTKKMFSTIEKVGEHNGSTHGRAHRWPNYKNGMTIVDVIETEGTEPWDVYNWEHQGIIKVTEPTDEEFAERKAEWYKKHGLTDPEVSKAKEAEEKAKAKAEREAEREAKKAEREKAKAEKEAAAKAKAEADEKAKAEEKTE